MRDTIRNCCIEVYFKSGDWLLRAQCPLLLLFGMALLFSEMSDVAMAQDRGGGQGVTGGYEGKKFGDICKKFLDSHKEGYGSLLTSIAGMGAILASAMGGFKVAWSLLVVAIGSFILNSYKNLWFSGTCA